MSRLTSCLIGLAIVGSTAAADTLPLKISTKRDSDRVTVTTEKKATIVAIHSPRGISQAVIERTTATWPDLVILRLHVSGLESFQAAAGPITLHAAVSSQDGRVRQWKDDQEDRPLDAQSPFWIELRRMDADGKSAPGIPAKEGSFELRLPKAIFASNPQSITVNWIDFFRN